MTKIAVVDAGPLYAAVDVSDRAHPGARATFARTDLRFIVPALVVGEVVYMIGRRIGPRVESRFLRSLEGIEVEPPAPEDWGRIADLVERYADFPLGTVDASVAVLADRLGTDVIVTLDRRHFGAIRTIGGGPFRILPE